MLTASALTLLMLSQQPTNPTSISWGAFSASKKDYYSAKASYPKFKNAPPLLRQAQKDLANLAEKRVLLFRNEAEDFGQKPTAAWEFELKTTVALHRADLASFLLNEYSYSGGAHPNRTCFSLNYAMKNGEPMQIGLMHLMKKGTDLQALMKRVVWPALKAKGASAVVDGTLTEFSPEQIDRFVITPSSITWYFPPYDVGAYAEGEFMVKVPLSDLRNDWDMQGPMGNLVKN